MEQKEGQGTNQPVALRAHSEEKLEKGKEEKNWDLHGFTLKTPCHRHGKLSTKQMVQISKLRIICI